MPPRFGRNACGVCACVLLVADRRQPSFWIRLRRTHFVEENTLRNRTLNPTCTSGFRNRKAWCAAAPCVGITRDSPAKKKKTTASDAVIIINQITTKMIDIHPYDQKRSREKTDALVIITYYHFLLFLSAHGDWTVQRCDQLVSQFGRVPTRRDLRDRRGRQPTHTGRRLDSSAYTPCPPPPLIPIFLFYYYYCYYYFICSQEVRGTQSPRRLICLEPGAFSSTPSSSSPRGIYERQAGGTINRSPVKLSCFESGCHRNEFSFYIFGGREGGRYGRYTCSR